jgi:DNA processing protein
MMKMDDFKYWLALSCIPGIGRVLYKRLIEHFRTPERVFFSSMEELKRIEGLGERLAKEILTYDWKEVVDLELSRIEKERVKVITLTDELYPANLKRIYDPPPFLYMKGDIKKEDDSAIAIVGSRKATPYGRMMAERLGKDLASHGVTVVSGMARGIDTFSHQGALSVGGRTVAVLGCGIDIVYPPENKRLMDKIIESGAVITEFPFSTPPDGVNFPSRNRIISGLSLGVVIIEATSDSGSLITASAALDQGREVFAVPGNITSRLSEGTNKLIKKGAKLVENIDDILEEILPQIERISGKREALKSQRDLRAELTPDEETIYNLLSDEPKHIDVISRESKLTSNKVSSLLLGMELKGAVRQLPGMSFVLN